MGNWPHFRRVLAILLYPLHTRIAGELSAMPSVYPREYSFIWWGSFLGPPCEVSNRSIAKGKRA